MKRLITFFAVNLFFCFILTARVRAQANTCSCWQQRDTSFHYVPFGYDSSSPNINPFASPPYYRNDDASTNAIVLPFNFCFWGKETDTVFINNNGNISFGQAYSDYIEDFDSFPMTNYEMIAPFWSDVETFDSSYPGSNVVLYKITAHYMIVQWDSVAYYNDDVGNGLLNQTNSFQVIISDGTTAIIPGGKNVEFCYRNMQWTTGDASDGTNGFGGYPGIVGANEGDAVRSIQIGLFDSPGSMYAGQYPPAPNYDGVAWLNNRSFFFNLCSGTVAPLVSGISPCDTFKICLGDSILVPLYFYSPVQGDSVWSNLSFPIPPGVSIVSNNPGLTDSLIIKITGSSSNYGYQVINLYGYDNQVPSDTTYTSFVVEVDSAPSGIRIMAMRDTVCSGDTSILTASGGKYYVWSTGATNSSIKVTPTVNQTYIVGISNGGCTKDTMISVVVLPKPAPKITATPDTVCSGDSALLIAGGGGPYQWSTGQTNDSIWVTPSNTSVYTLHASNGYCTDSVKISIHIKLPGSSVISLSNDSLCPSDTIVIKSKGGTSYEWSTGATTSSIKVTPDSTTTYTVYSNVGCGVIDTLPQTVTVFPFPVPVITGRFIVCKSQGDTLVISGANSYIWSNGSTGTKYVLDTIKADSTISVESTNGKCQVDTSIIVTVKPPPDINVVVPSPVCGNMPVTVKASATGTGPFTYIWSPGGETTDTIVVNDSVKTSYTLTVSNGCDTEKTFTIIPDVPPLTSCCNTTIFPGNDTVIVASGNGIKTFQWEPPGEVICLNSTLCDSVKVSPTVTTTYTVIGTDAEGCEKEEYITIVVAEPPCFDFKAPNVFTPNGDEKNDVFLIDIQNPESYQILIYDRWGREVFESTDPAKSWSGNTLSGTEAPEGVYYYILSYTCQGNVGKQKGFIQLIR